MAAQRFRRQSCRKRHQPLRSAFASHLDLRLPILLQIINSVGRAVLDLLRPIKGASSMARSKTFQLLGRAQSVLPRLSIFNAPGPLPSPSMCIPTSNKCILSNFAPLLLSIINTPWPRPKIFIQQYCGPSALNAPCPSGAHTQRHASVCLVHGRELSGTEWRWVPDFGGKGAIGW